MAAAVARTRLSAEVLPSVRDRGFRLHHSFHPDPSLDHCNLQRKNYRKAPLPHPFFARMSKNPDGTQNVLKWEAVSQHRLLLVLTWCQSDCGCLMR
jgi:hypothetical protein